MFLCILVFNLLYSRSDEYDQGDLYNSSDFLPNTIGVFNQQFKNVNFDTYIIWVILYI